MFASDTFGGGSEDGDTDFTFKGGVGVMEQVVVVVGVPASL